MFIWKASTILKEMAEFLPEKLRPGLGRDGLVHIQYTGEVLSVWRQKKGTR